LTAAAEELGKQVERQVGFFARDREGRGEGEDVLVVAAYIEHQAVLAAGNVES